MHCHTKEGSLDGKVPIEDFAATLREKGFDGMLVSDHDSYNGYRVWKKVREEGRDRGFLVLKGVEYDSIDAGHILVIMPDELKLRILEVRGLPVQLLVKIVHRYGGILGPAHPFGAKFLSAMCSEKLKRDKELIHQFDFVEAFNTCELPESNRQAGELARKYRKPAFGGSDSHRKQYVGTAYTDINYDIQNCNDFIYAVKNGYVVGCGGQEREPVRQHPAWNLVPVGTAWKIYNHGLAVLKSHKRKVKVQEIFDMNKARSVRELIKSHK